MYILLDYFMAKIGFACKYMHFDRTLKKKDLEAIERPYNNRWHLSGLA